MYLEPEIIAEGRTEGLVRNGNAFPAEYGDGRYRVKLPDGTFAAVYEVKRHQAKLCRYFLN